MKKIEVTTAQKVIIQYELASLRDRILAFLIDMLILGVSLLILFFAVVAIISRTGTVEEIYIITTLVLSPIFIFYTFASEVITNGRTLGKIAMGLKVIKVNGGLPSLDDYALRWVFRSVDVWTSLGAIAALLISSSDKSQRLGGLLSNTAVVKLKEDFTIKLSDLERMFETSDSYEAQYPTVTQFTDEDMLAIKELIKRFHTSPNLAHANLITDTANKISDLLQLQNVPKNKIMFLQSVLKDYVMLTR